MDEQILLQVIGVACCVIGGAWAWRIPPLTDFDAAFERRVARLFGLTPDGMRFATAMGCWLAAIVIAVLTVAVGPLVPGG